MFFKGFFRALKILVSNCKKFSLLKKRKVSLNFKKCCKSDIERTNTLCYYYNTVKNIERKFKMKEKLFCLTMIIVVAIVFSSCDNGVNVSSIPESRIDSEVKTESVTLISKEEMIRICELSEEEYAGRDLDEFIDYYMLTEDNVRDYNIHDLLDFYFYNPNNVEYIFDKSAEKRRSDFTKDAVKIAFFENKNTTPYSVYIDLTEKKKWAYEYEDVFWDLDRFEGKDISDAEIDAMLEKMDELGVFSLKDKRDHSNITDPMSFTFVIEYKDGSRFRVSRSGRPSKILPKFYKEWRELLFS